MQRVLILCTGNSARSQMAEGLLRHMAGDQFEVFSAGTEKTRVHPLAIEAMSEVGIDVAFGDVRNAIRQRLRVFQLVSATTRDPATPRDSS